MNEIKRRHFQPEKKFEIVKEAITSKLTVSEVCKTHGINTSLYYKWLQAFLNGALEGLKHRKTTNRTNNRELKLEAENRRLKEVISELASENLQLKKNLGE